MRSTRSRLALVVLLAALVRVAAFDIAAVREADGRLLGELHVWWGTVPYRLGAGYLNLFDPGAYALLFLVVVGAAFVRGRRLQAVLAAGVMLGASVTTQVLKVVLAEHRPGTDLPPTAWPSGHTTAAGALAVALVLVTPRAQRARVAVAGLVGTLLAGAALVALGRHWPSDVLGALCVVAGWAVAAFAAERRFSPRARPSAPSHARDG